MPSSITKYPIPYFALAAGILSLSFSGIFIHWSTAPGIVTTFYRMVVATLVLLPVVIYRVRKVGFPRSTVSLTGSIRFPVWLLFPIVGGLFTALDQGSWSTAIKFTRIANATLLNNIAPLWVALFAATIWRERLSSRFWVGLAMTLVGAGIVLGNDLLNHPNLGIGDGIALVSSLFWAGYYLITQRGRALIDTLIYIWLVELCTAILLGILCLALNQPLTGFPPQTWLAILGAGLISQVCGHFLLAYALGHLPASVVSPTMILQPVLTALLAIPAAGQALSTAQWLGGVTVLLGIYLVNISRSQPTKEKSTIELQAA